MRHLTTLRLITPLDLTSEPLRRLVAETFPQLIHLKLGGDSAWSTPVTLPLPIARISDWLRQLPSLRSITIRTLNSAGLPPTSYSHLTKDLTAKWKAFQAEWQKRSRPIRIKLGGMHGHRSYYYDMHTA
jgi:hypothetical protein